LKTKTLATEVTEITEITEKNQKHEYKGKALSEHQYFFVTEKAAK